MNGNLEKIDISTIGSRSERLAAVESELGRYRAQILWAIDALIPADAALNMPSASQAGVFEKHLPAALLLRDDAAPAFFEAVKSLPVERPLNELAALQALGKDQFEMFSRLVAGAFFLNKEVNSILRYPAQTAVYETPDYDYLMAAIEPVMKRGEMYTKI